MKEQLESIASRYLPKELAFGVRSIYRESKFQIEKAAKQNWVEQGIESLLLRPPRLGIETTNICNANCTFCAYQYQERPTETMSMKLFKKVIDDYVSIGGGRVELTPVVGDPLIDKYFLERIEYCQSFPEIHEIMFFTNAILFHRIGIKEVLQSGVTHITISTTAPDEKMYQRIYRSNQYKKVIQNLLDLLRINEELGGPVKITLGIRGDIPATEIRKLPDFKKLLQYPCKYYFSHYFDDWAGAIKQTDLSGNMTIMPNPKKDGPCELLFVYPKVLVDGSLTACGCRDYHAKSELHLGDITRNSLIEIWQNGKIKKILNRFDQNDIPDICKDCKGYQKAKYFLHTQAGRKLMLDNKHRYAQSR